MLTSIVVGRFKRPLQHGLHVRGSINGATAVCAGDMRQTNNPGEEVLHYMELSAHEVHDPEDVGRRPNGRSVLKIVFSLVVLAAYYLLPVTGGRDLPGTGVLGFEPGAVRALTVCGLGDGDLSLVRGQGGRMWHMEGEERILADRDRVSKLLSDLANASCRPGPESGFDGARYRLQLEFNGGRSMDIELGPRLEPLRRQLVRVEGRVLEVDRDLSATLGLWKGKYEPVASLMLHHTLLYLEDEAVEVELGNPFVRYRFVRGTEVARRVPMSEEGDYEDIYAWRVSSEGSGLDPELSVIHRWQNHLDCIPVERPASGRREESAPILFELSLRARSRMAYRLEVSGVVNKDRERVIRMAEPEEGVRFIISNKTFNRVFPRGTRLVNGLEGVGVGPADVTAVAAERDGHRFEISRGGPDGWSMVRPRVPYRIYTPKVMGAVNMGEAFTRNVCMVRPQELFLVRTKAERAMVREAFGERAARVTLRLRGGRKLDLSLSGKAAGTELRFLSVDGRIMVVSMSPEELVPDIKYFFDPKEVKGRAIRW